MEPGQRATPEDSDRAARVAALFDELAHLLRGNRELARRTLEHLHEQAGLECLRPDERA